VPTQAFGWVITSTAEGPAVLHPHLQPFLEVFSSFSCPSNESKGAPYLSAHFAPDVGSNKTTLIRAHSQFRVQQSVSPHFLILVLQLIKLPVNPTLSQQLLVGTQLAQLALVHDQDSVRLLHRG
jgi:hypothetical protein